MAKRSITIAGHRTSISLEDAFWRAANDIATRTNRSLAAMIEDIDRTRPPESNLSSAIRVYVLEWHQSRGARS